VNYPAWLQISDDSFPAYHRVISARIGFLIVPLVLATLLNVVLIWLRPAAVASWTVWATLAMHALAWGSALLVQIPIQVQLSQDGYSRELIERLIWTDLLYRKMPGYLRLLIMGWMLYGVVRTASRDRSG
jgi:hypothetical protein